MTSSLAVPEIDQQTREADLWRRFWLKVNRTRTCWVWVGARTPEGYGQIKSAGKIVYAHRLVAARTYGAIPQGLVVDHLCRNRACVRPRHLEIVTVRENTFRGVAPTITAHFAGHCKRGHDRDVHGYYHSVTGRLIGCRACKRELYAEQRQTKTGRAA